jgi:hypothetical protein
MTPQEEQTIRNALLKLPTHQDRTKALVALDQVREAADRRTRILGLVQECLSQLRLDVKYLAFDLDATRKERDELKFRLDGLDK